MKDTVDPEIRKWERIKRRMIENSLECFREAKDKEKLITSEDDIINVVESKFDMMKHLILASDADQVRIKVFMKGPKLFIIAEEAD